MRRRHVAEVLERQPVFRKVVHSAAHGAAPAQGDVTAPRTVH
jgi:hypothetical protein